jgi:hypothetical protein
MWKRDKAIIDILMGFGMSYEDSTLIKAKVYEMSTAMGIKPEGAAIFIGKAYCSQKNKSPYTTNRG